jgi:hypothetical protein
MGGSSLSGRAQREALRLVTGTYEAELRLWSKNEGQIRRSVAECSRLFTKAHEDGTLDLLAVSTLHPDAIMKLLADLYKASR